MASSHESKLLIVNDSAWTVIEAIGVQPPADVGVPGTPAGEY